MAVFLIHVCGARFWFVMEGENKGKAFLWAQGRHHDSLRDDSQPWDLSHHNLSSYLSLSLTHSLYRLAKLTCTHVLFPPRLGLRHRHLPLDARHAQDALLLRQHQQGLHGRGARHHDRQRQLHCAGPPADVDTARVDDAHRAAPPGRLCAGRPLGDRAHHPRGRAVAPHRAAATR